MPCWRCYPIVPSHTVCITAFYSKGIHFSLSLFTHVSSRVRPMNSACEAPLFSPCEEEEDLRGRPRARAPGHISTRIQPWLLSIHLSPFRSVINTVCGSENYVLSPCDDCSPPPPLTVYTVHAVILCVMRVFFGSV